MKFVSAGLIRANLLVCALCLGLQGNAVEPLPEATTVLAKLEQRAHDLDWSNRARSYCYRKSYRSEELDSTGRVVKSSEKEYEVVPIQGVPFSRLIKIQSRELNEEENRQQHRKEAEFRQKLAEKDSKIAKDEELLQPELIARYEFKVERRECVENRATLVLSFHPKKTHQPENTVRDRVLNRLTGLLWVDENEAEVVRVEVGLTEDLWLGWFGMVGSLKRCDFKIERQRLPDGVWVNRNQTVELAGRKVFAPLRYRTLEKFSNFRKS